MSQTIYRQAKRIIPGGTQLLSKRPEMFSPDNWPAYYKAAKGAEIWDVNDRKFLDMSIMAVGACILGYADSDVDDAVIAAIKNGVNSSLNCTEEVSLAERLIELHPWFGGVRYCRSGGEAMSIAVRIGRAYSNRDVVLFSGYHGWCDWYLAANLADDKALDGQLMPGLSPSGVPRGLAGSSAPFDITNIDSLVEAIESRSGEVGVVVLEPARGVAVSEECLKNIRSVCDEHNIVLIYDEITSGFRLCPGGMHRQHSVHPDIAVLAKSIANGYPMAVVMGTEKVMSAAQDTFISSTNWTDRTGPVAALATIEKYTKTSTEVWIAERGNQVKNLWLSEASECGIEIEVSGIASLPAFSFGGKLAPHLNALFVSLMLENNILGFRQFKPSLAHTSSCVEHYGEVLRDVFTQIRGLSTRKILQVEPAHTGFHRLTK